ncbi:hypothetical protein HPB50_017275 [Hyalomma asiaticum]|uniref:Uncharacterized protein n=1 Tax=Hyalomma asiaticum TaxID=266040 RepID=A0ACB7SXA8_HYAAI|nr:hypothetical protein HPB50_017275 [Hyalomma asiaticum]
MRAVVPGPRLTHASDPPPKPVTTCGTSQRPSSSSFSEPTLDVEVDRVDSSLAPSSERSSPSETSPPALSQVPASLERNFDGRHQQRHREHYAGRPDARHKFCSAHRVAC